MSSLPPGPPLATDPFASTNGHVLPAPPRPRPRPQRGPLVNVLLFVATCLTTLLAGTGSHGSPTFDAFRDSPSPLVWLLSGVPFAATLLAILVVHEFGHYFVARARGAAVSLPYFIPAPPGLSMGTFGAIIKMRSPARDRNALFDVAAAGPLAGLALAVPLAVLGLTWSRLVPAHGGGEFGDSLLTLVLTRLCLGPIPAGLTLYTHPILDAAWIGFLVTAINLLPAGQLDGGRILYALAPRRHQWIGRITVIVLVAVGAIVAAIRYMTGHDLVISVLSGMNWLVWAALIRFLVGFGHGPLTQPETELTPARRLVGVVCFVLLVMMLPPFLVRLD
jgi:membrane-associated protease RseP (regulator of RpoE activity)